MRAIACDTLSRCCARRVFCWSAFPLVPVLGSIGSAADCSALFAGFTAYADWRIMPNGLVFPRFYGELFVIGSA